MSSIRRGIIHSLVQYETGDIIRLSDEAAVIEFGRDLFESEDLVDKAYEVYISMMVRRGWSAAPDLGIADFGLAYTDGLYLCGVRRAIITHQYDAKNDIVPSVFSVWAGDKSVECFREIDRLPRNWRSAAQGRHFRTTSINFETDPAECNSCIVTLMGDGRIVGAVPSRLNPNEQLLLPGAAALMASVGIGLFCDRQHLWQVQTEEKVLASCPTPLSVGVSSDHIKSLFYARSLPLTESGRKRPILHWVRAHLRRIRDGIDVDISRHLRGVDKFEMGGFDWAIVDPVKKST